MRNWEHCYQTGETPWDKGCAAPPLLELIERHGVDFWGEGPVVVPGCGFGHDVRALAAHGVVAHGVDISETAVEKARSMLASGVETYAVGDFLDPGWRVGQRFSALWEHTCFCAIHPGQRESYADSVAAVLEPGGVLAGVFYLTPYDPGEDDTGPPFQVSIDEIDALFSRWFERIDGWVPQAAYPGREGREWVGVFRKLSQARVAG